MGENCADTEYGGTLSCEGDWGNIEMRERLGENYAESDIGGTLC